MFNNDCGPQYTGSTVVRGRALHHALTRMIVIPARASSFGINGALISALHGNLECIAPASLVRARPSLAELAQEVGGRHRESYYIYIYILA